MAQQLAVPVALLTPLNDLTPPLASAGACVGVAHTHSHMYPPTKKEQTFKTFKIYFICSFAIFEETLLS